MTKSSARARGLNKVIVAVFLAVFVLGGSVGAWFAQSACARSAFVAAAKDSSSVTVRFIDVGQGDSILIDTASGDVLIDGGPTDAGSTVVSYLGSLSITRIHLMIATHVHEDHIGGLVTVLNSITNVDEVLINNQTSTSNTYTNFMNLARHHTVTVAQRGQTFVLTTTVNLTVFNPVQPLEFTSENDNSVVVKLRVGNVSFLFTGDAEADAEQSMLNVGLDLKSDVLKVGHHGSRTATTQPFLDSVAPSYAIISAGINNPYGHPHPETIQKLLAKGVTIYGTFRSGTIVASTDGASIVFQDSPQPVPEFESRVILSFLITATLLAVVVYRGKRSHLSNL
jgi:competence protein ComEC